MKQGDLSQSCLSNVNTLSSLNGEPGCRGAQADPDILRQLLVPCDFMPFDEKTGPPTETRVLLFSRTVGERHPAIEVAREAIKTRGGGAGFTALFTEDPEVLRGALPTTQVVVFLMTSGDVLTPPQQDALERFIRAGGGFVGIHSAAQTEYAWPFYGELIGTWADSQSQAQPARVLVADATHPSTMHLPAQWMATNEWYNFRRNPRADSTVVLTVDESTYQGGTLGADHPIAWYRSVGSGRAFYTALGHEPQAWSDEALLDHVARAILWAAKQ